MGDTIALLKEIKGVDVSLAKRLISAGLNSYQEIAEASLDTLQEISGLDKEKASDIRQRAKDLAEQESEQHEQQLNMLLEETDKLKHDVKTLVNHIREEAEQKATGKKAKLLRKEISHIMAALEQMEDALFSQMKRLGKGLAKADAKLSKITQGDIDDIDAVTDELKKARKKLDKAID